MPLPSFKNAFQTQTMLSRSLVLSNSSDGHTLTMPSLNDSRDANVKITMKNSINKGSVNASTSAYGITNNITEARNVVSMGDVTGSSGSYTFWDASIDVHLFYGLNTKCINCGGATLFKHNNNTGFYEVVGTGQHVDDLLNDEAVNQHFGMVWSSELELFDPDAKPSSSLSGGKQHGVSTLCVVAVVALIGHLTFTH